MNASNLKLSEREVPIVEDMDVVVCGGGPSGLAAAIAAARNNAKTLKTSESKIIYIRISGKQNHYEIF